MAIQLWKKPATSMRPWGLASEIEEQLERAMGWPSLFETVRRWPTEEKDWAPTMEVFEKDGKLVVKAELPGVKQEDIDVSVIGDMLTIKGERKTEEEVKKEDYYRSERTYGCFSRTMQLPTPVDADKVEASLKDGVLEVVLPKTPEVLGKRVPITNGKEVKKKGK